MASASWDELMAPHSAKVQALAEGLRQVVRGLLPEATEIVRLGWQSASYRSGSKARDEFLAIMPKRDHVNLHLPDGVELRDPQGLWRAAASACATSRFAPWATCSARG